MQNTTCTFLFLHYMHVTVCTKSNRTFKLNLYDIFWLFCLQFFFPLPHWTHAVLLYTNSLYEHLHMCCWRHDIWTHDIWIGHLDTVYLDTANCCMSWGFLACMPVHLCNVMYITVLVLMLGCHFTIFIFSADIT